jgi:uncharacterized protein (TIGR02646 family)
VLLPSPQLIIGFVRNVGYCGQRLVEKKSHIEHLRPRSTHPHLDLDYENLLVSCQRDLKDLVPRHCGTSKQDWFDEDLMVSPLNEYCETFFEYSLVGEILPTKDKNKSASAQETINRLNLDIRNLRDQRKSVIDSFFFDLEKDLSREEVTKIIEDMSTINEEGYYKPYCSVLIYLLKLEYSID